MKKIMILLAGLSLILQACSKAPSEKDVLTHYADLAQAMYQDSLTTAQALEMAVDKLIAEPGDANLAAAREAWKAARVPYQQTEVYRFGNGVVDEWEGKVNAWPMDEGLIDYVAPAYGKDSDANPFYTANVIANEKLMIAGHEIDATNISKELLANLQEAGEIEANVATGYHAIEFLLWGQDLNGTGPGAGNRPASDYDQVNCSNGHCDRRAAYLKAAAGLLIDDLSWIVEQWGPNGAARQNLFKGNLHVGLAAIFTGMGSLSYGELAGERMKLGLMLHDPEEEHDCFSDNTHWSHFYDVQGVKNVYTGAYTRVDGKQVTGPGVADLVSAKDKDLDKTIRAKLDVTLGKMQALVDSAEKDGVHYDQLLATDNEAGGAMIMAAVDALLDQTRAIEQAVALLQLDKIAFEGSDSLDNPDAVQQ